MQVNLHTI